MTKKKNCFYLFFFTLRGTYRFDREWYMQIDDVFQILMKSCRKLPTRYWRISY